MAETMTVRWLQALEKKPPPEARQEIPDGNMKGLYLIRQPSGVMSWAVRYRFGGKPRKHTLGGYPALGLADARTEAGKALRVVAEGRDPGAEKQARRAAALDVSDLFETVLEEFLKRAVRGKIRSVDNVEANFRLHVTPRWKGRKVQSITRRDVITISDALVDAGSPIAANRVFASVRRFFNWCVERSIIEVSPCAGLKPSGTEVRRDRVLSDDEIRIMWQACGEIGEPFGAMFKLLLLTGQRRDEVAEMRRSEVDGSLWTVPAERSKNGQPNIVPISSAAAAVLEGVKKIAGKPGYVFTTTGETPVSGFSRAKERLDKAMLEILEKEAAERGEEQAEVVLEPWRVHDLRRTAATGMARLRIAPHVIEAVLNHRSGQISGVAAVYNRYQYQEEKAAALAAWASFVEGIVSPKQSTNVIELRGRS